MCGFGLGQPSERDSDPRQLGAADGTGPTAAVPGFSMMRDNTSTRPAERRRDALSGLSAKADKLFAAVVCFSGVHAPFSRVDRVSWMAVSRELGEAGVGGGSV